MKKNRKFLSVFLSLFILVLSTAAGCSTEAKAYGSGEMTVHFLDVGQGLSVLVQSEGQTLLYDGGDRSSSSTVVSYLQSQQVTTIDYLISSHYDTDHVSGLIGCLNAFSVNNVIGADYVHDSSLYESFMAGVMAQGLEVQHPGVGTMYPFGSGSFTILAPSSIDPRDSNQNSVAIKLTNGENHFILTGDAEYGSELEMVQSGIDLTSDVLCLGHHGSASSTTWDLLQAAVPEYAVLSCGTENQYGHPDMDTMDKLLSMEIPLFRTDKQGTIVAVSDGASLTWNVEPSNDYTPGDSDDMGTLPDTGADNENFYEEAAQQPSENMVWLSPSGSKYHSIPDCGRMNPATAWQIPASDAINQGYDACGKCF